MTTIDILSAASRAAASVIENGGATVSAIVGVNDPTTGYAVSIVGHEEIVDGTYMIWDYAERKKAYLAQTNHFLGVWEADYWTFYLDITERITEKAAAIALARARRQSCIYDIANKQEIYV